MPDIENFDDLGENSRQFCEAQNFLSPFVILQLIASPVFLAGVYLFRRHDAFNEAVVLIAGFVWLVELTALFSLRLFIRASPKGISVRSGFWGFRKKIIQWRNIVNLAYVNLKENGVVHATRRHRCFVLKGDVLARIETKEGKVFWISLVDAFGFLCAERYYRTQ